MRPDRKDLFSLTMGTKDRLPSGDPDCIRDNCPVCGKWTENLNPKKMRCGEEECEKKLVQKAIDIGVAVKNGSVVVGDLSAAIKYMPKPCIKAAVVDDNFYCCVCNKEVRRPGDTHCIRCRLKSNSKITSKRRK